MSDDVAYTAARSGPASRYYHTKRDCHRLQQAATVFEYTRSNVAKTREHCSICKDGADQQRDHDCSAYRALRDADAAEVPTDD